ncbi:MAG: hypothetical protein IPO72_08140 [Saprospiraceae bacterium]|nr:hypothetical protein [Candidatus Vicinibacter affinis]MBP6173222.1 zinc-dependent metalloprotease [Saprospiraceae bacterium]MBK7696604.1 hypothetical protein [Candidatus Vicinibacter affinis]MBK7800688.1 hypothetical protein [Candidatus Vicinibacter affinis]MBK8644050.1 hypothetical protein [Candidatus Vicinibacter affinis]
MAGFIGAINSYFLPGNIEFTFDEECIHRVEMPNKTQNTLGIDLMKDSNGEVIENTIFGYKRGYINAYVYQVNNGSGFAWGQMDPKNEFLFASLDPKTFAHELGHVLSLFHTRANQDYTNPFTWECKGGISTTLGDFISDTYADPYTMDLDDDKIQDKDKWFSNCSTLSEINNYPDACGNTTIPWNPPISNLMGIDEAHSCWDHFTPCQFSAMHCEIENNLQNYLTDCLLGADPTCSTDIEINIPTVWSNITKIMCPGQKIKISKNGSLTLINSKITKSMQPRNTECPTLTGMWDGIYIESAGYGSGQTPGGPPSPTGGILSVTENSVIEFSINGIQAPGSHNGITISNSKMENNGIAIYSKGPGGLISSGNVLITSSQINSSPASLPVLIRMNGSNLTIQSSSQITNLGGSEITGIKSYNGKLIVKYSTIKDFGVGIDKELNGGIGIGLILSNNHILGDYISVRNTSSGVTATKNYFEGEINQIGKSYGRWYANTFKKDVSLNNPTLSYFFSENQFDGSKMALNNNQSLTDATCNVWKNTQIAAYGFVDVNDIKASWGAKEVSSGNKHDGSMPGMINIGTKPISNYQWLGDLLTVFTYGFQFTGRNADAPNLNCQYNLFPTQFTGGGGGSESEYNNDNNNQLWSNLTQQLNSLETQAGNATGQALQYLQEQIADVKVSIGQTVLNALQNIDPLESPVSYDLWVSRGDVVVSQQITMIGYWNSTDYSGLYNYINGLSLSGDDHLDRGNLLSGLNTLTTFQSQSKNLSQLEEEDLNILIGIASSSFGSYTALIRAWLNIQYDIRIDPPAELNSYSRKYTNSDLGITSTLILVPNPTSDCVELIWRGTDPSIMLAVTDLTGKLKFSSNVLKNVPVCLKDVLGSGLFILQISSGNSSQIFETRKLIIK